MEKLRIALNKRQAEFSMLTEELKGLRKSAAKTEDYRDDLIEAKRLIIEVIKISQEQVKGYVESLVTLAIQAVFPDRGYRFIVDFEVKSNRGEVSLLVQQGEKEPYIPKDEQAGSLLNIIGFALKVVMWSLENPKTRNVFILDEPFVFAGALTKIAGQMMKDISKKLKIQIIMTTHSDDLIEIADKAWIFTREKESPSKVTLVEREPEQHESKPVMIQRRNKSI